eukprot:GHVU01167759.1.p1 GENE.GHVU01167759.1~~GHVU01167759.1.p1  ORF type:complete len:131 (+),score=3.34 GHVU01167759.1:217-609(+)
MRDAERLTPQPRPPEVDSLSLTGPICTFKYDIIFVLDVALHIILFAFSELHLSPFILLAGAHHVLSQWSLRTTNCRPIPVVKTRRVSFLTPTDLNPDSNLNPLSLCHGFRFPLRVPKKEVERRRTKKKKW